MGSFIVTSNLVPCYKPWSLITKRNESISIYPGNLFLNRWQDLKLGDFGLSAVTASGAKLVHAVGTLGYGICTIVLSLVLSWAQVRDPPLAAPEIMRHKPYDAKSDIYALGCSLYEMATLRSVYDDQHTDVFPVPLPNVCLQSALVR